VAKLDVDPDKNTGPLVIHGVVKDPDGKPVAGALVECWHANSHGFYSHFDPTEQQSPFNLRGAVRTGADGKYEFRKLTTQFNIEGDPLIWDDFAYATREDLIPPVTEKTGGAALGLKADTYKDIEFNISLTSLVDGKDNQLVNRERAAA